jgi:hypothetical protein
MDAGGNFTSRILEGLMACGGLVEHLLTNTASDHEID